MRAPELHAPGRPAPPWQRAAVNLYLTIRVSALGFSAVLPLVGAASVVPAWSAAQTAWLLAATLAFHVFAYMFNDVIDLWVDRTEPLRADSPLVRGELGRTPALAIAWAHVPLAFGIAWAGGAGAESLAWLTIAFAAMTLYDLYGKRCPWPLLTDAVQSIGWSALLLFGAHFGGASPSAATGWLAAYVFGCVMLVNGVHGGLRDLANDHRRGARTTAAWLGARAGAGDAIVIAPTLAWYALALQAALAVCAVAAWHALDHGSRGASARAFGLLVVVLAAAVISLLAAHRQAGSRRGLVTAGAWNIVATVLVLPALVLQTLGVAGSTVLLLAFALPVLAMWAYNGSHWRLGAPAR